MAPKADYTVISETSVAKLNGTLHKLALEGWKPILMTTIHAVVTEAGQGNVIHSVLLEHVHGS